MQKLADAAELGQPYLSLVVPVYNEEQNVQPLVEEVRRVLQGHSYELILVDDGSPDETVLRIPRHPEVRIIRLLQNSGQSTAMFAGMHAARGQVVAFMDGDMQNDPADLPLLLAELEKGADLACGYRKNRRDTFFRRFQSRIANFIRSRLVKDGVRDTGCSLKAMRKECREALPLFDGMHRFIPALIKGMGYRIVELPVNHRPRERGVSKYTIWNRGLRATRDMFAVRWLLSRQRKVRSEEVSAEV